MKGTLFLAGLGTAAAAVLFISKVIYETGGKDVSDHIVRMRKGNTWSKPL